ncbi:MAG: DUF4388 domain-containing protein, partial [Deltaproteobacteria bacterium]
MSFNGDVKTFPLPAVVRMIHTEGKTGQLKVTGGNRRCCIYFKKGKIVFASGNADKGLRLGELLMANNLISKTKLDEMLTVAQTMDKRLGVILVENGYLSPQNLIRILVYQFKEVITKAMAWNEAKFTFVDGLDGYVEDVRLEIDPVRIVAGAEQWKGYRKLVPNDHTVFQIKPGSLGSKSIYSAAELRILLLLNGKRSVDQLIKETGYSRLAVYRTLAQLASHGAIFNKDSSVKASATSKQAEATMIIKLYQSVLQLIIDDLAAELGNKKATVSFESSLRQSTYYGVFLKGFRPDQSVEDNVGQLKAHLERKGGAVSDEALIRGFNQVVAGLLREQSQFLGSRATSSTLKRVIAALAGASDTQRSLAQSLIRHLSQYESGKFPRGADNQTGGKIPRTSVTSEDSSASVNLDKLSGRAVVSFFNDMLQVVTADLERELGTKAIHLFQGVIKRSRAQEPFRSLFDQESLSDSHASRTREQIETSEINLGKTELVLSFQEVLMALL